MAIDFKKTDTNGDKTLDTGELLATVFNGNPVPDNDLKILKDNPNEFEAKAKSALAEQGFKLGKGAIDCLHVLAENGLLPHKPTEIEKINRR